MSVVINRRTERCTDYVTFRCPVSLREALQLASERERLPASEYMREALRRSLREDGIELLDEPG
jgi:hypothetical protein